METPRNQHERNGGQAVFKSYYVVWKHAKFL